METQIQTLSKERDERHKSQTGSNQFCPNPAASATPPAAFSQSQPQAPAAAVVPQICAASAEAVHDSLDVAANSESCFLLLLTLIEETMTTSIDNVLVLFLNNFIGIYFYSPGIQT